MTMPFGLPPAVVAQQPAAQTSKSLLDHIASGGPIGYAIIALSFVAVALIVAQLVRLRVRRLAPPAVVAELDRMLRDHDVSAATAFCQRPEHDAFLTRVFGAALSRCARSPFGFLELRAALEEAGQEQVARLQRSTDTVGLIASVAPMLGLLGTVVGMVGAFETISFTEGFARPDQLAGDISVALMTTVLGLLVAIPCTAAYAYLRNRVESVAAEVAQITEHLAAQIERHGPDGPSDEPRAPATRSTGSAPAQPPAGAHAR